MTSFDDDMVQVQGYMEALQQECDPSLSVYYKGEPVNVDKLFSQVRNDYYQLSDKYNDMKSLLTVKREQRIADDMSSAKRITELEDQIKDLKDGTPTGADQAKQQAFRQAQDGTISIHELIRRTGNK